MGDKQDLIRQIVDDAQVRIVIASGTTSKVVDDFEGIPAGWRAFRYPGATEHPACLPDHARRIARVSQSERCLVTTFSSLLLVSFGTLVATGLLPPTSLRLIWASARGVAVGRMDNFGRWGDWPETLGDAELRIDSAYLDAGGVG